MRQQVGAYLRDLQDRICASLEEADGQCRFREDAWSHPNSGGGRTRTIAGGDIFEKGAVNFSQVSGTLSDRLAARLGVAPQDFFATGVSLVVHPENPHVPTAHMNVRYLELDGDATSDEAGAMKAWFGGGADLTPYYLVEQDATEFHRVLEDACNRHDPGCYAEFKRACDAYFFNKHRGEARGVGGIFFDYLHRDLESVFAFVRNVGDSFCRAYLPIVRRRSGQPWSEAQRRWQAIRRGRYVEFNLIHDRGTLFGLETGGRTESILVSLPPEAAWAYDHHPDPGSPEAALLEVLRRPRDWI